MAERPRFRKLSPSSKTDGPEELFLTLPGRAKTHGYLRGPQQDALRAYEAIYKAKDVAFELPTGSGKTLVGLLIAEWHRRRSKGRAAFITLTNQLAAQVIEEARRLNIPVADLRGDKLHRSSQEEGRFNDATAIAVSTYSNLFNVNPVIKQCEALILDDAHGGGDFAAAMWTVRIASDQHPDLLLDLQATLQPLMTETQSDIFDPASVNRTAIVDIGIQSNAKEQLINILDERLKDRSSAKYSWSLVRNHLHACHLFVSRESVIIRPYITPTFDNPHFESVAHRIYLSATLGDIEDLRRAYAIEKVEPVRAAKEQDGRRFVFAPGLTMGEDQVRESLRQIWEKLNPKRAVVIAPSFLAIKRFSSEIDLAFGTSSPSILRATDIEESLSPFTSRINTILTLANRYDGLDLPDDDCRLLMLSESPRATNELEANLSSAWKLGPALRWREATRLVQGMGRCTRNATDFAVIVLLGESLINAATNSSLLRLLPPTLQREIEWGRAQLQELGKDPDSFASMVIGLIEDSGYRNEAEESLAQDSGIDGAPSGEDSTIEIASKEVAHSKALWDGDYSRAHELANEIADKLSGPTWAGYRAWWQYNASIAARYGNNLKAELTALRRAKASGINAGWLDHLLRSRQGEADKSADTANQIPEIVAERIWNVLDELGWSGKRFHEFGSAMTKNIENTENHKTFHQGLAALGKLRGAVTSCPSNQGDPDVIWRLIDRIWICWEAKSKKLQNGQGLSKHDVLEAKGHVNWVQFFETQGKRNVEIYACIVAPTKKIHPVAEPHTEALYFVSTSDLLDYAKKTQRSLLELRSKYTGQDFAAVKSEFTRDVERLDLDLGSTIEKVKSEPL